MLKCNLAQKRQSPLQRLIVLGILICYLFCAMASAAPVAIAEYRFEADSWNGSAGEILDNSGNNYHGQVIQNSNRLSSSPALAGSLGTCGYASQNAGAIQITGLPLDTSTNGVKTTVTFWMNWDGTNSTMPIGWKLHDIFIASGSIGFNSAAGDIYGISSAGLANSWHHIAVEFTNGDVTSNKMYIDGIQQTLTQRQGSPNNTNTFVNSELRIGGWSNGAGYEFHGLIDEVRVYQGTLTTAEIVTIKDERHPCPAAPIADYRFDELLYSDLENEVVDSIGGFNGRAKSTQPIAGKMCNAVDLTPTGTTNYLILDEAVLSGQTDFTVSVWAKTSKSTSQSILSGAGPSSDNELIMWFSNSSNFKPYLKGSSSSIAISPIDDNNWHHLVWTREGTQSCIYKDKVKIGCATQSDVSLDIQSLILGQEQDSVGAGFSSSQAFDGLLDELLVYHQALTQTEITTLYDNQDAGLNFDGSSRTCPVAPTLLLEYRFEEESWNGTAAEILDNSGNGHHAKVINNSIPQITSPALSGNPGTCGYASQNDGSIQVTGLPLDTTTNGVKTTVTFWMNWDGTENSMPIGWNIHDIWFVDGSMGFNSGAGDLYGISSAGLANGWHHVAVEFTNGDVTSNKIHIDGVEQMLTQRRGSPNNSNAFVNSELRIGGWSYSAGYEFHGLIDEVRVYQGALATAAIITIKDERHPCPATPIADYRFDELLYADVADEVVDSIGGYNGRAKSAQPVAGKMCNAVDLTTTGTSDYLVLDEAVLSGQTDFTVSVWAKTSKSTTQSILAGANPSDFNDLVMWFSNSSNFKPYLKGSSASITILPIDDNNWHHLVWTRQGDQSCIYQDKVLAGCVTQSSASLEIQSLILGQEQDSLGGGFDAAQAYDGLLDELLVYHQALTESEISTLYDNQNAGLNYDGSVRACPSPVIFYQFEEESWANADDVLDSSASANHGNPVGGISPFFEQNTQKSCQVLDIPKNTSNTEYDAVDSGFDPNDLGSKGTISFWYRSDEKWNSDSANSHRYLFDASEVSSADPKYFFLSMHDNGGLYFGLQDENDGQAIMLTNAYTFAASEWVHIAVTWDLTTNSYSIYVNGAVATIAASGNSISSSTLADVDSLYIGDNRNPYFTQGNSANGQIDDFRVYNFVQTAAQINTDSSTLSPCNRELVAYYQFEQESWASAGDVLDSTTNGNNGSPVNSNISSVLASDQIACRYLDVPKNTSATTFDAIDTGVKANSLGNSGTISFWYRSNEDWDSGNARQLFDASTDSASNPQPDKHFFLVLTASGNLQFALEDRIDKHLKANTDTSFSFAAQTWVHVAVTWSLQNDSVQIVVNGAGQTLNYDRSPGIKDTISDTGTLYLGDSRSSYFEFSSTGNSANGQFDELRLYESEQNVADINIDMNNTQTCPVLDHYRIEHDTKGFTCEAEAITIKACSDPDCNTLFTESASITLSPTGWNGGDTLAFTEQLSTTLNVTTESTITFSKGAATPEAALRCFNGSVETCDMQFVNDGFEFSDANGGATLPDQLAANNFVNINLRAIRNDAGVCKALLAGEQDITLTYDCDSPNVCLTPFAGIPIAGDGSAESSGTVRLTFDSEGVASLSSLSYADAGRVKLKAQAEINNVTITATTNGEPLDIYPSYLALSVAETELNYAALANENNYVAGENFNFVIGAYGTNDQLLPNYQIENSRLKVTKMAPTSAGANGTLKYADSGSKIAKVAAAFESTSSLPFSAGEYRYASAYYSEVGRIEIDAKDSNYLGNEITSNGALLLGNFYPAYFNVALTQQPILENTCGVFSYLGQDIEFASNPELTITAYNALDEITQNYSYSTLSNDNFWNYLPNQALLNTSLSYIDSSDYTATGSASVINLGDAPLIENNNNFNGTGTITIDNGSFKYDKMDSSNSNQAYALVSPFAAKLDLVFASDFFSQTFVGQGGTESICYKDNYASASCKSFTVDDVQGTEIRYGRLVLESTYGPETEALNVPVKTEYFAANQWRLNTDDNCTDIAFTQTAGQIVLTAINGYDTSLVGDVTSDGTLILGQPVGDQFRLQAPDSQGQMELSLDPTAIGVDWPIHLNYDWNGDGNIDTDDFPKAIISFGQFRSSDTIIQWREVFN